MSRTAHGARLCDGHTVGFSPSQIRKYDPACVRCVELRGHLPPGERDRAPEHQAFVFTNGRPPMRRRMTKRKEQHS